MRFLCVFREGVVNVFERPLRTLSEQGDEVTLLLEEPREQAHHVVDQLTERAPAIRALWAPMELRREPDVLLDSRLRAWIDYLSYLEPERETATKYKEQRGDDLPQHLSVETERAARESPDVRQALMAGLKALERTLPIPDQIMEIVERERPDALLVSPLMTHSSTQVHYVRAARRLGIPSGLCIASWDNLPSKGLIHEAPDLVTVWNHAQRDEAERIHGIPPDRIAVTGAPRFDDWLRRAPATSREEYCARLGLPADRPHILYVGSTTFKRSLHEGEWIADWIARVRASGHPELEGVPVVVRPHPKRQILDDSDGARRVAATPNLVVHPAHGATVTTEAALSEYFDSLYHAAVVVGLNTSALVEAAVVGRGVHVLLAEPFREIQEGAPHFEHLRSVGGGLIVLTDNMEDHAKGLAGALRGDDADEAAERASRFVESFIRPHGLDQPATPLFVDAVRALAKTEVPAAAPETRDLADGLRPILLPPRLRPRGPKAARAAAPRAGAPHPEQEATEAPLPRKRKQKARRANGRVPGKRKRREREAHALPDTADGGSSASARTPKREHVNGLPAGSLREPGDDRSEDGDRL